MSYERQGEREMAKEREMGKKRERERKGWGQGLTKNEPCI